MPEPVYPSSTLYPSSPTTVDPAKLAISPAFRSQVPKVMAAVLLFILVYIVLVAAAVALIVVCAWLGIMIIAALTNTIGIILGIGIIAVGISVFIFLIKFIFAVAKDEDTDRVEITENEQPRLFQFVRELSQETGTRFPKRIYLSSDVNASVFYNSSFWSMFLPIRKNLNIGLGLINSVNLSEFKAVIAHEFGHFSQKSMRLGSFTYNVNRVVYNMLYQNNDYTAFLQTWGSFHSFLRLFVQITVKIAAGIQWLLKQMYGVINKRYMGLSREMEFHADMIAASVAGSNNAISALARIEVASGCYHTAINDANQQLKNQKVAQNIYSNQRMVMQTLAAEYHMPVQQGLPEFTVQFIESFTRSRINYKDQWASHPTLKDRAANLGRLQMPATTETASAWDIFDEAERLQRTFTGQLYRSLDLKSPATYDVAEFAQRFREGKITNALPPVFNGFYDDRYIDTDTWDFIELIAAPAPSTDAAELFNSENAQIHTAIKSNRRDLELLKAIAGKKTAITSFDFDGAKYTATGANDLATSLETEIETQTRRLQDLDKTAFLFFLHLPNMDRDGLRIAYDRYRSEHLRSEEFTEVVNRLLTRIRPLYAEKVSLGKINDIRNKLKDVEEAQLKKLYNKLLDDNVLASPEEVRSFVVRNYAYFYNGEFLNNELNDLTGLARKTAEQLNQRRFEAYKSLLHIQASAL